MTGLQHVLQRIHQSNRAGKRGEDRAYPAPVHLPLRLEAATLSRTRAEDSSRSNWAKDNRTFRVSRPIDVVVLNCWVTATNEIDFALATDRRLSGRARQA